MIPFSPPRIDQRIIDEVVDTLKSGWITTGPKTKLLEQRYNDYCGTQRTLCLNSATAGMELVLRWFGVKEGDEVILPAYTYAATANVVVHCGAKPVMVDVGKDFNIDVDKIAALITSRTKVIIPVDIAGMPCDLEKIIELVNSPEIKSLFNAQNKNQSQLGRILIMNDAAHSAGAVYKEKKAAQYADFSVYSFHAVKNLTTAEGGAICIQLPSIFNADEIYQSLNISALHGQNKDALAKSKLGGWKYDIIEAGYKCNMTDIAASIGLIELERYESETLHKRKAIMDYYQNYFSAFEWAELPTYETQDKTSSYHLYMLRIRGISEDQRNQIIDEIYKKEVSVNVHFQPLPLLSFYKNLGYDIQNYPSAYDQYSREISLPVYFNLTQENLETVCQAVKEAVAFVLQQTA